MKYGSLSDTNIRKYYIFTRPTKVDEFRPEEWYGYEDEHDEKLMQRAKNLQLRRWRKIKHQLV